MEARLRKLAGLLAFGDLFDYWFDVIGYTDIFQGDSPTFRFEVLAASGEPFNLSDYDPDFFIKRSLQDTDAAAEYHAELTDGIELPFTTEDGMLDITIPFSVTANLRTGRPYFWYLLLTHSIIAGKVFRPARGLFLTMLPNV